MSEMIITPAQIKEALGEGEEEFLECMRIVNDIIENPDSYTGMKAMIYASKLAALRTAIGVRAAYFKTGEKSIAVTRKKNFLISMEHNLEENINCLKLLGRVEGRATGVIN